MEIKEAIGLLVGAGALLGGMVTTIHYVERDPKAMAQIAEVEEDVKEIEDRMYKKTQREYMEYKMRKRREREEKTREKHPSEPPPRRTPNNQ